MAMRQLVIQSKDAGTTDGLAAIGSRKDIVSSLRDMNTSPEQEGGTRLYGPGIAIDVPDADPVTQMMLTVMEEEIAWLVIMRIARKMNWKLLDLETGRELSPT